MDKIALVFSGQGSQYAGMGKELFEVSNAAKNIFKMADEIRPNTSTQCFEGTKEQLTQTINTQPCLFCVDLAAACALKSDALHVKLSAVAGFSLGEIPAIAFSGMLPYEDAFSLVIKRAQFMSECAEKNKGSMIAVLGINSSEVENICKSFENAYPVNYNCKTQTVVACSLEAEKPLIEQIKKTGGKALKLPVSGAFHSPFMKEASEKLKDYLENININVPNIPIYSNVTAKPYSIGDEKQLISNQVCNPVRWQQTIENMIEDGINTFVEVGAGKTLSGLIKKIDDKVTVFNVEDKKTLEVFLNARG